MSHQLDFYIYEIYGGIQHARQDEIYIGRDVMPTNCHAQAHAHALFIETADQGL